MPKYICNEEVDVAMYIEVRMLWWYTVTLLRHQYISFWYNI